MKKLVFVPLKWECQKIKKVGASVILTDYGGMQKEAFSTKSYDITLRDET